MKPVISTVAVSSGRIDFVADQPRESVRVGAQLKTVQVLLTDEPRVSVEVAHDQDVVGLPATRHGPVHVDQSLQFIYHCVRVHVNSNQHQLGQR